MRVCARLPCRHACSLTSLSNYVIFWVNGFVMEPSINIPQSGKNATQVLWETALWSSPTDITSGKGRGDRTMYPTQAKRP